LGNVTIKMLLQATWETLQMTLLSSIFGFAIALPLGVLVVVTKKGGILQNRTVNIVLGVLINILRSVPFALLLIYVMPLTRAIVGTVFGTAAMVVPLTLAAAPFIARLIETSLSDVDSGLIEAAKAMGATRWQIINKVYLRESLPSLVLAVTVSIVSILGYTAMANLIGGGGLGDLAYTEGFGRYNDTVILVCIILLVIMTQAIQWAGIWLNKKLNKKK